MVLLDIDFPMNGLAASDQTRYPPLLPGSTVVQDTSGVLGGFGSNDFPYDRTASFDGLQFDDLVGLPHLESFLPDTTFDFEAFFSAQGDSQHTTTAISTPPPNRTASASGPESAASELERRIGPATSPSSQFQ
jgi:hypothetical protein